MEEHPLMLMWGALFRRRPTGGKEPRESIAEQEVDLDIYDDVSFVKDGREVYGTVTEIRNGMAKVAPFDDSAPIWVDGRELEDL